MKTFREKSDKKQNIFLHNSIKISGNLQWSKTDLSKELKNCSKKRYSTNFSSSHPEVLCKKPTFIFKISPAVYLHIIKIDIM